MASPFCSSSSPGRKSSMEQACVVFSARGGCEEDKGGAFVLEK